MNHSFYNFIKSNDSIYLNNSHLEECRYSQYLRSVEEHGSAELLRVLHGQEEVQMTDDYAHQLHHPSINTIVNQSLITNERGCTC